MKLIDKLLSPKLRGGVRHLLSSLGPLLAMHGVTTDAYWQVCVGILMAALAFYDSWSTK